MDIKNTGSVYFTGRRAVPAAAGRPPSDAPWRSASLPAFPGNTPKEPPARARADRYARKILVWEFDKTY